MEEKRMCAMCKIPKILEDFGKRYGKRAGKPYSYCKDCFKIYHKNFDKGRTRVFVQNHKKYTDRNKEYLWNYLLTHSCVVCGESDPIVLEFDHIDPTTKDIGISILVCQKACSIKRIEDEISKCQVLCANCHRRKSAKALGYWKTKRSLLTP